MDLEPVFSALNAYAEVYSQHDSLGRRPESFIDGRVQNIQDAEWLYYEGTVTWFSPNLLAMAIPWLVMNVLVKNNHCTWAKTTNSMAIEHPLIESPITCLSLKDGTWLREHDYDEAPDPSEIALESYHALLVLFSQKLIYSNIPTEVRTPLI